MSLVLCCMCVYVCVSSAELQLVVEQHFQRHEQTEAGLSDSPDTPSPITTQQPNGAAAQWANHSSSESYVSCDGQAGSSEEGGKWRSELSSSEKLSVNLSGNIIKEIALFIACVLGILAQNQVFSCIHTSRSKGLKPLPRTGFLHLLKISLKLKSLLLFLNLNRYLFLQILCHRNGTFSEPDRVSNLINNVWHKN